MTENNKPEWFEIVEADGPVTPPKASKILPIAAAMVTALIIGIGTVVGQVGQESPAMATQNIATPAASVSSAAPSPADSASSAAPVVAATTARLANPSIAMLPTNGDDEDEDDEDEDDDEYEDEEDDD